MQNLNIYQYLKVKNNHSPLLFNAGLWSVIFITLMLVFTKGDTPIKVDFAYTSVFLLFLTIPVFLNFYLLIPKFLKNERYFIYALLFLGNWIGISLLIDKAMPSVLNVFFTNLFFISYPAGINIYIITSVVLVASTLLKLTEDWFYFNTNENRLLRLKNTQVETQLSVLRAQINPHSLNVVYALALEKNPSITKSIVQLSDILRYVIYDSNVERVTLSKEIELIENYINFQKLRQRDQHQVSFANTIENKGYKLYPMLLLPLIENAYKHGDLSSPDAIISINLVQKNSELIFKIKNSKKEQIKGGLSESSGIGLENIKSNLQLVYPNSSSFILNETSTSFEVIIKINDPTANE